MTDRKATGHPELDLKPLDSLPEASRCARAAPPRQAEWAARPTCPLRLAEREVQHRAASDAARQSKPTGSRVARTLGRPDFGARPSQVATALLDGREHRSRVQAARPDGPPLAQGGAR